MRVLLSVYDKAGIVEFARELESLGASVVSSGGTAATLRAAGVACTDVADITGYPAILGHRVVTLHPMVHGAILGNPADPSHAADLAEHGIEPFDVVVVNLYPFSKNPSIEMIDVGGPAMVRAAAKNHERVAVIVDPAEYESVLAELRASGTTTAATRRRLARAAFAHTAAYDAAIVTWLDAASELAELLPPSIHLTLEREQSLRYGENPHQQGALYTVGGKASWWSSVVQHGGKELSYLNVFDTDAAWRLVHDLGDQPAAVVIKHANPCGAAVAADITSAYLKAHACDPVSAFGGIVAVNRPLTVAAATALAEIFTEVIIAPGFETGALKVLAAKKNLRVLEAQGPERAPLHLRSVGNAMLAQTTDTVSLDRSQCSVPTKVRPTEADWAELSFAWRVCAHVSSNAIVLTAGGQAVGIGAGQQNRVESAAIALKKANGRAGGGAAASDAFFPFRDGLDAVAGAGIRVVVQPGGSVRDAEVVAAADEHGIAMVFTGERHFRH